MNLNAGAIAEKTVRELSDEEVKQAALDNANQLRALLGLPPVERLYKGKVKDETSCAITMTVYDDDLDPKVWSVYTNGDTIDAYPIIMRDGEEDIDISKGHQVPSTLAATEFIRRFDNGAYPELVKE